MGTNAIAKIVTILMLLIPSFSNKNLQKDIPTASILVLSSIFTQSILETRLSNLISNCFSKFYKLINFIIYTLNTTIYIFAIQTYYTSPNTFNFV